jgi:ubiquinone/menaquinone biosynthesis C-methylase UbiE
VSSFDIMTDYTAASVELNDTDGEKKPSGSRAKSIKDSMSAFFDTAAQMFDKGELWNWGMYDEGIARQINELIPNFDKFDTDGFSEQMYFLALRQVPIDLHDYADKSVLDVGCGMGAGLNFLARVVDARSMVGLDLSPKAIERANASLSRRSNLRYVEGDAERIPFDDNSFDVVVNIESAHNYPDLGKFLDEVTRVLKPGGYLTLLDLCSPQRHQQLTLLKQTHSGLVWIHDSDVSAQVKAGIARRLAPGSHFRRGFDEKRMPLLARWIGEHARAVAFGGVFAGHPDTTLVKVLMRTGVARHAPRLIQNFARGNKIKYLPWVHASAVIESAQAQTDSVGSPESYRHYVAKKA